MLTLKVIRIGGSAGVFLNREALALLGVSTGDTLQFVRDSQGSIRIEPRQQERPNASKTGKGDSVWREVTSLACGLSGTKL